MELERAVHGDWASLMRDLGTTEAVCVDWWSVLSRRYGEQWRFYHTLSHIHQMIQLYHQWKEMITDLKAVALAIFFHDIVYDPQAGNNETQSILVFEKFALDAHLSDQLMSKVSQMIKSTITHSVNGRADDVDLCLFLDFDLAVLGQESKRYKAYAGMIRQEYIHVKDEAYRAGRTKVLHSLLNSPSLFASEEFRAEYEEQARKNMMTEISDLECQGRSDQ